VRGRTGPWVESVRAAGLALGDRTIDLDVSPNVVAPDSALGGVSVTLAEKTSRYLSEGSVLAYRQAPDASSGLLRLPSLVAEPGGEAPIAPPGVSLSGHVSWTCQRPAADGPIRDDGDPPPVISAPGTATLTFSPAVVEPVVGAIQCQIDASDPTTIHLGPVEGTFAFGPSTLLLRSDGGGIQLALAGPDGLPAGEYAAEASEYADDLLSGGLMIGTQDLRWRPTDPRYVPIGGIGAPRSVGLHVDLSCDLRQAAIPGFSTGRMDVAIGSGIDRTWSVDASCTWRMRAGRAVVTQVVNLSGLDIDGEPFRAYGRPDILFVTSRFGTRYGIGSVSAVTGPVAPDGSTGELAFQALRPRGRVTNVNGRLGGRGGPLSIDGTLAWSCGAPPPRIPAEVLPG
jgi:hypothetical protein